MCGRFTLRTPLTILAKQFDVDLDTSQGDFTPRFNIAPTQDMAAVRVPEPKRQVVALKWDSRPNWQSESREPLLDGPNPVRHGVC